MSAIEAETCGMLGRVQFQVQAIVGFARLCAGDLFEVVIKHGHQRWRTRGKTQADKTQRWDQQPPAVTLNVLWNVPIQVKVLEVGFLRSRCLNERQFDPAKFAVAQPQLVTMNLNTVGSIKLQLVVQWLPLLSSTPSSSVSNTNKFAMAAQQMPMLKQQQQAEMTDALAAQPTGTTTNGAAGQANQKCQAHGPEPMEPVGAASAIVGGARKLAAANGTDRNNNGNCKIKHYQSEFIHPTANGQQQQQTRTLNANMSKNPWQSPVTGALPPKVPAAAAALARLKQQNSLNGSAADAATSSVVTASQTTTETATTNAENNSQPHQQQADSMFPAPASVKVCLRDKKRQREQRRQCGLSMAAAICTSTSASSGIGIGGRRGEQQQEAASRADKQRWRSSTTLLDEVYKDLARSIPTIDDLSALHCSSSTASTTTTKGIANGTGAGGSLGHHSNCANPAAAFESNSAAATASKPGPVTNNSSASLKSTSCSEGRAGKQERAAMPTAKRIFSFVKRSERSADSRGSNQEGGSQERQQQQQQKHDWRKSASLGQIVALQSRDEQQQGQQQQQKEKERSSKNAAGPTTKKANGTTEASGSAADEEEPDEFLDKEVGVDVNANVNNNFKPARMQEVQQQQQILNGNNSSVGGGGGSGRRAKLSSLKKSRQQQQQQQQHNSKNAFDANANNNNGINIGTTTVAHYNNGISKHSSVYSLSSSSRASSMDSGHRLNVNANNGKNQCHAIEQAIGTLDTLLSRIERIRLLLTQLRPAEFTELVAFEAAMLNWEACLKLNRSRLLCQLDSLLWNVNANGTAGQQPQKMAGGGSGGRRSAGGGNGGGNGTQQQLRQRLANNRSSLYLLHQPAAAGGGGTLHQQLQQQHSPSTASDETDEGGAVGNGANVNGGPKHQQQHHNNIMDHISENDSGIDSLRQYHHHRHSPSYNSSSFGGGARRTGSNAGGQSAGNNGDYRRKSIGAMLDAMMAQNNQQQASQQQQTVTGTGSAEMDRCLQMHLERAEQALQAICDVQDTPFEYTLAKMLCRMESIETIALESMLGMAQQHDCCKPNPQNVLAQLGLQFQLLQQCWLQAAAVCHSSPQAGDQANANCSSSASSFLLASLVNVRRMLRPLCEPIVQSRYPKLVEKVLDSLLALLCDQTNQAQTQITGIGTNAPPITTAEESTATAVKNGCCNGTTKGAAAATTTTMIMVGGPAADSSSTSSAVSSFAITKNNNSNVVLVSVFQFVALFRAKQFPAFIENLSHEAWISTSLQSGQPAAVRDVMERLRNVPVVPPLESLRHIGLVLSTQPPHVSAPIEKYFRKASPELALDLAACFLCLLEHDDELSRCGACRALATLRQANTSHCLEFLSRSDTSPAVRAEAQSAALLVHRHLRHQQQLEMTKI